MVTACKQRLVGVLTNNNKTVEDSDIREFTFTPDNPVSPNFNFGSSTQPSSNDFLLKKTAGKRKRTVGLSKKSKTDVDFFTINDYINNLDLASSAEIKTDLEYLHLQTDGSDKTKRKRINNFLKRTGNMSDVADQNSVDNRLSVLENSNTTICTKLDEIKTEISAIGLVSGESSTKSTTQSQNAGHTAQKPNDKALFEQLNNVVKEMPNLLQNAEKTIDELKNALSDTKAVKTDLKTWSDSVFKGADSERIAEIHRILSPTSGTEKDFRNSESHKTFDHDRFRAKKPSDTKTNPDTPGLPIATRRASYRRNTSTGHNPTNHKYKKRRNSENVVLITDSVMRSFCGSQFSKQFNVQVIYKRSIASLRESLSSSLPDICKHAPKVVYIHLGSQDINDGRTPDEIKSDFQNVLGDILGETSQACSVIISHILSTANKSPIAAKTRHLLSGMIQEQTGSGSKALFWRRVSENHNSNFFNNDEPNPIMFRDNLHHLSERGIRVIMGNFRTSLVNIS